VHPLLVAALHVAVRVAEETDGLVDPCLGRQLVSLGYDADLGLVRQQGRASGHVTAPPVRDAWRALAIDGDRVLLPPDVALDLGATAKAWASDLVAQSVADETGTGVLASLGGDVSVVPGHAATLWPIAISERPEGATEELVGIESGGLATSSTVVRRWTSGGVQRHHLLHPRTGAPVDGPWRTVTATGSNCVTANAATTAALVLGDEALDWLEARQVPARLVHRSGEVATTHGWPAADRTRPMEPA
jgi:thiamine biosynthesis lipoprotein